MLVLLLLLLLLKYQDGGVDVSWKPSQSHLARFIINDPMYKNFNVLITNEGRLQGSITKCLCFARPSLSLST